MTNSNDYDIINSQKKERGNQMITENIKKYTLTEEEISAIKTTFEIVNELRYEEFDNYGDFYDSCLSFEDTREILKLILENNDENLE